MDKNLNNDAKSKNIKIKQSKPQKLRKDKGRKLSQTMWLQRRLGDAHIAIAKEEGYVSRAAFKLIEIDAKFNIIPKKKNACIVDLGSAPGSWLQVLCRSSSASTQKIISVDLQKLKIDLPDNVRFIQGDFTDQKIITAIKDILMQDHWLCADNKAKIDGANNMQDKAINGAHLANLVHLVLSDMAPSTSGSKSFDQDRIFMLALDALEFAIALLAKGGGFVAKIFQSGNDRELFAMAKSHFNEVRWFKPNSSYKDSSEIFLVCKGKL